MKFSSSKKPSKEELLSRYSELMQSSEIQNYSEFALANSGRSIDFFADALSSDGDLSEVVRDVADRLRQNDD